MTATEFRPIKAWFTYEVRCLVCGLKCGPSTYGHAFIQYLRTHCDEGVLERKDTTYRQVKPHPVGFPGIMLPQELEDRRVK